MVALGALILAAAAGWADAHAHLVAAQKAIRSVHFVSTLDDGALVVETTFVAPDRLRVATTTANGLRVDSVTIGDRQRVTGSLNGRRVVETAGSDVDWSNVLVSQGLGAAAGADGVADVVDRGVTYGAYAFSARTSSARPPVRTTCVYDKTTYHVVRCASALGTTTFDRYDDPRNAAAFDAET